MLRIKQVIAIFTLLAACSFAHAVINKAELNLLNEEIVHEHESPPVAENLADPQEQSTVQDEVVNDGKTSDQYPALHETLKQ